jgi:hypothetical protein
MPLGRGTVPERTAFSVSIRLRIELGSPPTGESLAGSSKNTAPSP